MAGVRIHSRTEALTIVDDEVISRRIKLDFEPEADNGSATVRLRGLRCGSVRQLEVRENGRAVPIDVQDDDFLAVVPAAPEQRRVLEVSYEEELKTAGRFTAPLAWLGFDPSVMVIALPEETAKWFPQVGWGWWLTVTVVATIALLVPAGTSRRRSATPRQDRVRFRSAKAP